MTVDARAVRTLAAELGIAGRYTDAFGVQVETSLETERLILEAFGLSTRTEADVAESVERVRRLRRGLLPALVPVTAGTRAWIPLRRGDGEDVARWRLEDETGQILEGNSATDPQGNPGIDLAALRPGYYHLSVERSGAHGGGTVISSPPLCWHPEEIGTRRLWGITAQTYSLVSDRNLGIGEYSDVADAATGAHALGASFLGLSPVHALFSADRSKISPYSPSSRLFLEPIHIDVTAIPGFAPSATSLLLQRDDVREALAAAKRSVLVDHEAVWAVKRRLLEGSWAEFGRMRHAAGLAAFRALHGEALEAHATFEALHEHFRTEGRTWAGDWPAAFRDPHSPEVRRFAADHADRIAFYAWLQFQADNQLAEASRSAHAAGMAIGLYRDLAVGADRGGSEVWAGAERFAPALSIGAPPDPLGPHGQKWGLPPFNPLALEAEGLAAFRAIVAANMRHAGAIRIDHAFKLQRLFLIPEGAPPREGAYVDYPFEALLALLRLESHRAQCLVIAEDLGTAPQGFSDAIMRSGILSYRVLFFERSSTGTFTPPAGYPPAALAVLTTHDLPTFRGWWRGLDVDLRQTLGLFDSATAERERTLRIEDRQRLSAALAEEGLLATAEAPEEPPLEAAVRFLARSEAALIGVQCEDAAGEINQANLPGVWEGHPNWRRKLSVDLDTLLAPGGELAKLAAGIAAEGRGHRPSPAPLAGPPPRATYRLQLHRDFNLDDAAAIVPYLARLGISHVYASPILQARPGSTHGYDIVNHAAINPELGGEEGFQRLSAALARHGLGLLLDIVPNHMAVGGDDNAWWLDVLEWGELSPAARYFDIDWGRLGAEGKVIVPFLGERYGDALENGNLKLGFDESDGSFSVWHWEHKFPICPLQYPMILERAHAAMPDAEQLGDAARTDVIAVSEQLRAAAEDSSDERRAALPRESQFLKARLRDAAASSPILREGIDRAVTVLNGTPGLPETFGTLHRILEAQAYRLAYWRVAASEINYRRFFDINSLAGLRMEEPELFEKAHGLVFGLTRQGLLHGLRIDHIDGLADPESYLRSLQQAVGPGFYVVVEKILEPGESLRAAWPVAGTTGYDAMNLIDGLFVQRRSEDEFEKIYREFAGLEGRYSALLRTAKAEILETSFSSELEVLVSDLKRIANADRRTRDTTTLALRRALVEIIARFPVYRTYVDERGPSAEDRRIILETINRAKRASALPDLTVHDFIQAALLDEIDTGRPGRPEAELVRRFRIRFQQLTGPVTAKSVEDTLFYRYVRLLSLNEVGGDPGHFGTSPDQFHAGNAARRERWPNALVATATHDTKRGEDVRGRLSALSELPEEWAKAIDLWRHHVDPLLGEAEGDVAPDRNDQYLILQTLLGAWPNELLDQGDERALEGFRDRIEAYVVKALREAKRHTSWVHVREPYEAAALALVRRLFMPECGLFQALRPLTLRLAFFGALNGLSRTVLKCTVPGVPDVYQGTEFWDLSLVDPDNRRPVDYAVRSRSLEDPEPTDALLAAWRDGRIKQRVLSCLLSHRARSPALYAEGGYVALAPRGSRAEHVTAFMRNLGDERLAVAVPRHIGRLVKGEVMPLGAFWETTNIPVPPGQWHDVITGRQLRCGGSPGAGLTAEELFGVLPIAVLSGSATA